MNNVFVRFVLEAYFELVLCSMMYITAVSASTGGFQWFFSLLIVVSVTMDTVTRIQSHLIAHQYEGLIKKSRVGGKRRR